MPFLNRYNKEENYRYFSSLKIGTSIYNVGYGTNNGKSIITRLDTDGNVIWDKTYHFDEKIVFRKIVACSNNSDFLVLGTIQSTKLSIIRFNSEGTILWKKQFGTAYDSYSLASKDQDVLISIGNDNYILAFSHGVHEPETMITIVIKLNGSGEITAQKIVKSPDFTFRLKGVTKGNNKIGLYGSIVDGGTINNGGIIELDFNLNLVLNVIQAPNRGSVNHLIYNGQNYYVHCFNDEPDETLPDEVFFVKFTVSGTTVDILNSQFYTGILIDNLKYNSNYLYTESYDRLYSIISKIDYNLDVLWTKRFDYPNIQSAQGILCDVKENEIILNNGYETGGTIGNPVLGSLDLQLNSCRTTDVDLASLGDKMCLFEISDANVLLNDFDATLEAVSIPVLNSVIPTIEVICEDLIDPPCIKDADFCKRYDTILLNFIKCIDKTKENNTDYPENPIVFKDCYKNFLDQLNDIDEDFPTFSLIENLHSQITAIQQFLGSKGENDVFLNAQSAVQFILDYLSQLGNCSCENSFNVKDYSMIQSGHLYLDAAGSTGDDSTKGVHLRWLLRGALSKHLPKANYATTTHHFNKPNDFVKIYRAKYDAFQVVLDFNLPPLQINETGSVRNWIYEVQGKVFYVHFRDANKYNTVRASVNPQTDTLVFIKNYGDSLLEIETRTELSFKISPTFVILNPDNFVNLEVLSVLENKITAPKTTTIRKKYNAQELNETKLTSENIRSIRFRGTSAHVERLTFEFYSDFILKTKEANRWQYLGKYALTKEDNVAHQRLEPQPNCIDNWLRYNEDAYVNVENYQHKWNGDSLLELEKIVTGVEKYITLSEDFDNVRALETLPLENTSDVAACNLQDPDYDPEDPDSVPEYDPYNTDPSTTPGATGIEISYLELLQIGSLDYHVARMIGLGTLDLNPVVYDSQYIYLSEYVTYGDLNDGLGARQVQHLYCSLPTSIVDQRFCIPIDLKEPVPGIFYSTGYEGTEVDEGEEEDDEPINDPSGDGFEGLELTADGYSPDGKTRYYSFFTEQLFEEQFDAPFYYVDREFISSEHTQPVFAGLEYRKTGEQNWIKPELSHTDEYFNTDTSGVDPTLTNETVELIIPESGQSLYTHAVKNSGELDFSTYGINWFSRARYSDIIHKVKTILRPANELLPPTNISATLIQKEYPLLLTTSQEQILLDKNIHTDKTLVRLTFDYNIAQELIDYHQKIDGEMILNYAEADKELFADRIQIFFRNQVPNSIAGQISVCTDSSNPLLCQVETSPYVYASINETVVPVIPNGMGDNFIGSIMIVDGVQYVIHQVDTSSTYPKFTIFKSHSSGGMADFETVIDTDEPLLVPEVGSLFMIVENMQNTYAWGAQNPSVFEVEIDHTEVYREDEIIIKNIDCSTETHVQKFRGIYQNAIITKEFEMVDENEDGSYDIIFPDNDGDPTTINYQLRHLGLYKVVFPGFQLDQHSQFTLNYDLINPDINSVEFYNGIVRLHTLSDIGKEPRKVFKVVRTENIGGLNDLVLYIEDLTFPTDPDDLADYKGKLMSEDVNVTTIEQMTNYYPGYKVYLYEDPILGLTADNVLPQGDDEVRYTIFGLRSKDFANEYEYDNTEDFYSKLSVPTLMFAQAIMEPVRPQLPTGGMYATRPDFFGKASYTFNTKYGTPVAIHKPYSVQFNRASDIQFLSAIYDNTAYGYEPGTRIPILNTVQEVMADIFMNGEEAFYVDRWINFLSFDYPGGVFETFEERTLPIPNNPNFITSINDFIDAHNEFYHLTGNDAVGHLQPGFNLITTVIPVSPYNNTELQVQHFFREVILNCFVPLTEIPVIYKYVKNQATYFPNYKPIPKKQVTRDRNGYLLKPDEPNEFDMAPMMKRLDPISANEQYESQFTDFGLDGASNAKYFYAVREFNNQMKVSDYSPILGPISLVNTAPPIAPEIIKIIPVLENRTLGVNPAIQLQINAYPVAHKIAKVTIYRTANVNDALSVRTMKEVRVFDLEVENLLEERQWIFNDDFSDLPEVPFGDPLYYRITVSRRIRYNDKDLVNVVEYAPSEASKLIVTNIIENYSPESPVLEYTANDYNPATDTALTHITLSWNKTVYKGNYHVYKMNSNGNWVEIMRLVADRVTNGDYHFYNQDAQGNWVNTIHPEILTVFNDSIYLPLELTNLGVSSLDIKNSNNESVYHHFKVLAMNTAGMMSKKENILTMYDVNSYHSDQGISSDENPNGMIIEGNFTIRD
ncbi:hypothetical protein [Flavobacterium sp. UBA7682]|uniref:hypothetical protein n=1 Tax=Flavobacterium sp. UBA7682 TaxID=1946560 RepID=UPI0025BA490D|nr:hypothetical protein [Flavobacterium sp. UBA7682]